MPAIVKRSDAGTAIGIMITANEQRFEDTPMNRARKAARALERGKTEEEVALAFGTSVSTVKNLVKLLDAPAAVRNAVDAGKITASDGYKLARLEPSEAKEKVDKLVEHAPRTPGKKRSRNASKAREIVGGKKRKGSESNGAAERDSSLRGRNQIENVAREASDSDKLSGPAKQAIAAFAAWVLKDSDDLSALV